MDFDPSKLLNFTMGFNPFYWIGKNIIGGEAFNRLAQAGSDKLFGTTYGQERMMQQQFQYNNLLSQDERTWQESMMDKMNAYNTPSAMMQRFRDAGLNPSLMYGSVGDIGAANPPASGGASVSALPPQYSAVNEMLAAQVENLRADTEKKREETIGKQLDNAIKSMDKDAYTEFYVQNKNDIIRSMTEQLGITHNEFVQSNYDRFEAAWDMAIYYGMSFEDAYERGNIEGYTSDTWSEIMTDVSQERFDKAQRLFVGGRDAQISANDAIRVLNDAQKLKSQKDFDIWKFLINQAKNGHGIEKTGAQVALTALFISGEKFNIPMPHFTFRRASHDSHNVTYVNNDRRGNRIINNR